MSKAEVRKFHEVMVEGHRYACYCKDGKHTNPWWEPTPDPRIADLESRLAAATEALRLADVVVEACDVGIFVDEAVPHTRECADLERAAGLDAPCICGSRKIVTALALYRESRKETTDG